MVIDGNIKFLIVKHNLWHWWFPKWHIEEWETEEQTAKRELVEETWIVNVKIISKYRFVEKYDVIINWKKNIKTVVFFLWELYIDNVSEIHILKSELSDYLIDNYDNVSKLLTYDSSKKLLEKMFLLLNA